MNAVNIEGLSLTAESIDQLKYIQQGEVNDMIMKHSIGINSFLVDQLNYNSEHDKAFIDWLQSLNTLMTLIQMIKL